MGVVSFELPSAGEQRATADVKVRTGLSELKTVVNGNIDHENISPSAAITKEQLAASAKPVTWYTPVSIATEETRENVAFGTLTTKDEITGVVVPANGLLIVYYSALVKSSVSSAGRAAIFLGSTAVPGSNETSETNISGTAFGALVSAGQGAGGGVGAPLAFGGATSMPATGFSVAAAAIQVAAGTYAVGVRYRATSGSVTAKERTLRVEVHGF